MSEDSHATYRVVFWGQVDPGLSRKEVALKFARQFRVRNVHQLKHLFSGRVLTLKRGLSESRARRFSQVMTGLGVVCRLEREGETAWQRTELPDARPRHTATIRFDLQGLSALDFPDAERSLAVHEAAGRNPFSARDLPEAQHPPVRYYDGRPVR